MNKIKIKRESRVVIDHMELAGFNLPEQQTQEFKRVGKMKK